MPYDKPKGRAADAQTSSQGAQDKKKAKGKSKGKDRKAKPTAKSGDVDFDENAQAEHDEPEEPQEQDDDQEEDPEPYLVEAQSSSENGMSRTACLIGLLVSARTTQTVSWQPLRVRVQTHRLNSVTHGNGVDRVV